MSESTNAACTALSPVSRELSSAPPLVPAVVLRSEIQSALESSGLSERELLNYLILMTMNLNGLVLNGDVWWLAHNATGHMIEEMGVPEKKRKHIQRVLEVFRKGMRKGNPMAGMFADATLQLEDEDDEAAEGN